MQKKTSSPIYSFVLVTAGIFALVFMFATPNVAEAGCLATYTSCNDNYYQQYPVPQYVYYQDPSLRYRNSLNYTPVVYPIPLYVQTGINQNGYTTYNSYNPTSNLYPQMTYVPYNTNNYGYNPYASNNGGFTMNGGSYANQYGASSNGFINTSGR